MLTAAAPAHPRRCKRAASRGASLIEIIVVLVLLGLLLAAAMPEVGSWMAGLRVRGAAESLRNGVEIARMEALRRNTRVSFWMVADANSRVPGNGCALSTGSPAWVVSVSDPSGACGAEPSLSAGPQLVQRSQASESADGLSVAALSAGGAAVSSVTFNGLGQVQSTADGIQTIDVSSSSSGGRRLRVVVESGGAIRMCDRDVASSDPRACPAL
ncbi:pilus assembly FimT family protein [Roseateles violae]|uniref:Type II secretion system protein H n=1 Tax=Roseateles violae TaxID=3058042 RepID=A0ABT8DS08_9BURK|nr:GspH/FimT family pseudopilin [Pelomonas sp. PFR6]MDN3921117.1 GspH/FimT family pseudopilin [Pelomonas sp. PFR6]